jgi:hypothetical protein
VVHRFQHILGEPQHIGIDALDRQCGPSQDWIGKQNDRKLGHGRQISGIPGLVNDRVSALDAKIVRVSFGAESL